MSYKIIEVKTNKQLNQFILLPKKLYKGDEFFVMPIKYMLKKTLTGKNNQIFNRGPIAMFLIEVDGSLAGRVLVGIDNEFNEFNDIKRGYISLFESIKSQEVAFTLFDTAKNWLVEKGMNVVEGPISPTAGEDYKGLLIKGFNHMPSLLCSYNPSYYVDYFDNYGFEKFKDATSYYLDMNLFKAERYERLVGYAMERYDYHLDTVNKKEMTKELKDIEQIIIKSIPKSWNHFSMPSFEDIEKEAKALLPFLDSKYVFIARRNSDNLPIGFIVGAPNYNEVIQKLNGRLSPLSIIKFLYYRKKIKSIRVFMQFVIPEFQGKGVPGAAFYEYYKTAKTSNITSAEGGTIIEENTQSHNALIKAGADPFKEYRLYRKSI